MSLSYLADARIIKKGTDDIFAAKKTISDKEIVLGTLQTTYRKTLVRFIMMYFSCLC